MQNLEFGGESAGTDTDEDVVITGNQEEGGATSSQHTQNTGISALTTAKTSRFTRKLWTAFAFAAGSSLFAEQEAKQWCRCLENGNGWLCFRFRNGKRTPRGSIYASTLSSRDGILPPYQTCPKLNRYISIPISIDILLIYLSSRILPTVVAITVLVGVLKAISIFQCASES
ncbi:hypothetical protein SASPL_134213 [Salvia splendens]|uniref:Uncharacterized protein n=1 Tax=Salvia splendens TaxID=180675 RepID=A0A8X8ZIP8_SALSN|nr:hypothetical protein SASPL_134213 [Salvia splendens]